jgi:cytochrome P450
MNPSVQHCAQAEVDAFLTKEQRLPTLHDQAAFPYLGCVIQEVLRWSPPSPLGLFHSTSMPDTYKDFFIPAKTTVIANIWAMMHDESVYPEPFVFDPARFMGTNPQVDPRGCVFGFGRRICAGYGALLDSKCMVLTKMLDKTSQRHPCGFKWFCPSQPLRSRRP